MKRFIFQNCFCGFSCWAIVSAGLILASFSGCEDAAQKAAEEVSQPKSKVDGGSDETAKASDADEADNESSATRQESPKSVTGEQDETAQDEAAQDDASNEANDGDESAMSKSSEAGVTKSSTGLIVKDELPDADISSEASDLSIEPEYVDPRKHDPVFEAKDDWVRLAKDYPLWIDRQNKQVIVDGRIAQIHALLEMFACPVDSGKEHESIVGVYCDSELLHAALLAVGAKAGHPVIFQPEFKPAAGTTIKIEVIWEVDGERKSVDAKKWVQNLRTKEPLDVDWVFGGSQFYVDDRTGNKYYLANGGEMVCVSNFATAMMDLPAKSSADAAQQEYEANTDAIPALGTPVRLIFKPDLDSYDPAKANEEDGNNEPAETDDSKAGEADKSEVKPSESTTEADGGNKSGETNSDGDGV